MAMATAEFDGPDDRYDDQNNGQVQPATELERERQVFEGMITSEWADSRPSPRIHIDPQLRKIIDRIQHMSIHAGRAEVADVDELSESVAGLNAELREAGYLNVPLIVSGKLRPIKDSEGVPMIHRYDEEVVAEIQIALPETQQDVWGEYHHVPEFQLWMIGAVVDFDQTSVNGSTVLSCQFSLVFGVEADSETKVFRMNAEDIDYIAAEKLSVDGIELLLKEAMPKVYEMLMASTVEDMPHEDILEAMQSISFLVAKQDCERTNIERDDLIEMIGRFLSERIGFDELPYELTIDGEVFGVDYRRNSVSGEYKSPTKTLIYDLGALPLPIYHDEETGETTCIMAFTGQLALPGKRSGTTQIYIPATNVEDVSTTRSIVWPFGDDTAIEHAEFSPGESLASDGDLLQPDDEAKMEEIEASEIENMRVIFAQLQRELPSSKERTSRIKRLAVLEKEMKAVLLVIKQSCDMHFVSHRAAGIAGQKIAIRLDQLRANAMEADALLHFEGSTVFTSNPKLTKTVEPQTVVIEGLEHQDGERHSEFTGYIEGDCCVSIVRNQDETLQLVVTIGVVGNQGRQYGILDDNTRMHNLSLNIKPHAVISLSRDVEFRIVELERHRLQQSAISAFTNFVKDKSLRPILQTMYDELNGQVGSTEGRQLVSVSVLKAIAESTNSEDLERARLADDLLDAAIPKSEVIKVNGVLYDGEGDEQNGEVSGVTAGLVDFDKFHPDQGRCIVLETIEGSILYVPIAHLDTLII